MLMLKISSMYVSFPIGLWTIFMITAVIFLISTFLVRIANMKAEFMARLKEMAETIDDMIEDHDEELEIERRRISAHCIKIRMQKRDCLTKVGSLQRKLREKQETVKNLNMKLESMEDVEEDANDLIDELIAARETNKEKDKIIESLRNQLKVYQMGYNHDQPIMQKLLQDTEDNKENMNKENKLVK